MQFPCPPPFPPVPLLPGNTEPNDSLLPASTGILASKLSHGPVGALIGGISPNRSEGIASVIREDNVGVCTGSVNGRGKVLPDAPICDDNTFTVVAGIAGTDIAGDTGAEIATLAATFRGGLFATLGGIAPVSSEYKSFQYLTSP